MPLSANLLQDIDSTSGSSLPSARCNLQTQNRVIVGRDKRGRHYFHCHKGSSLSLGILSVCELPLTQRPQTRTEAGTARGELAALAFFTTPPPCCLSRTTEHSVSSTRRYPGHDRFFPENPYTRFAHMVTRCGQAGNLSLSHTRSRERQHGGTRGRRAR